MKLGANSVLFGGFEMETAFKYLALAGYDGIEISAIEGMSEHLVLDRWPDIVPEIKRLAKVYGLELLAMEQNRPDPARMEQAFQAAVEAGIPIINCGPGGKADDEASLRQSIDTLNGTRAIVARQHAQDLRINRRRHNVGATRFSSFHFLSFKPSVRTPMPSASAVRRRLPLNRCNERTI